MPTQRTQKKSRKKSRFSKRIVSYIFLLINTITWGLALIIVKPSFAVTTPFRFLLYRYVLAAFLSLPILLYYWPKIKQKMKAIRSVVLVEIFGTALAFTLLYTGLNMTSAIEASFLTTTTPIFVVIAGLIFLKEKQELHESVGLVIAFLGTCLLTAVPILVSGKTLESVSLQGNLLIILQNVMTAIAMVLAKRRYKKYPKLFVTSLSFYVGIVAFFSLSLYEVTQNMPHFIQAPTIWDTLHHFTTTVLSDLKSIPVWVASGYMALFGSIIGLTAYIKGQDGIEASEASLFWYLQPLVFVPAGILFLGESVHWIQIVSLLIIFFGVYIAERRSKLSRLRK